MNIALPEGCEALGDALVARGHAVTHHARHYVTVNNRVRLWVRDLPRDPYELPDESLVPSHYAAKRLEELSSAAATGRVAATVVPDGVTLPAPSIAGRATHRVITTEAPEKGLYTLLDVWPFVLEKVPSAELFVFSNFKAWKPIDPVHAYLREQLLERVVRMPGVKFLNRAATSEEITRSMQSTGVWAHLISHPEFACPNALLAQACGARVVSTTYGCMAELVGTRGVLVPGDPLKQETRLAYVRALVYALTDETFDRAACIAYAARFSWESAAKAWEEALQQSA